ncbi:dUTP diphosphatase [Staphylococcus delphini]|uniref:dUTP diphosphatase n=1 Tax=Staphylococcus delphini TaxID=53344 RepID=UPI0012D357C7|nr:dUTP pyrophosphatase [Staphylococcus delphini]MTV20663.1 dUTP pyrophosphatase [Staphylococcus delphini]
MTNTLQIKLLSDNATMPQHNHDTDAGFDIYAAETVILEPQEKALIATDIAVNIPKGYVGLLTSRSGVSSKTHLVIETGKIDAGFQGHMQINIKNDNEDNGMQTIFLRDIDNEKIFEEELHVYKQGSYRINKGERIAQLVIVPIWTPELQQVEEFDDVSARGEKGFGSSGY